MKAEIREEFLNKFTHETTRAFAAALYDLEDSIKLDNAKRVRERVLDVVGFYDEVDQKELDAMGLEVAKQN